MKKCNHAGGGPYLSKLKSSRSKVRECLATPLIREEVRTDCKRFIPLSCKTFGYSVHPGGVPLE